MSAADVRVALYADDRRASVTAGDGRFWWVAPSPAGGWYGLCDEDRDVVTGGSAADVMGKLLGDLAHLFGCPQ